MPLVARHGLTSSIDDGELPRLDTFEVRTEARDRAGREVREPRMRDPRTRIVRRGREQRRRQIRNGAIEHVLRAAPVETGRGVGIEVHAHRWALDVEADAILALDGEALEHGAF